MKALSLAQVKEKNIFLKDQIKGKTKIFFLTNRDMVLS